MYLQMNSCTTSVSRCAGWDKEAYSVTEQCIMRSLNTCLCIYPEPEHCYNLSFFFFFLERNLDLMLLSQKYCLQKHNSIIVTKEKKEFTLGNSKISICLHLKADFVSVFTDPWIYHYQSCASASLEAENSTIHSLTICTWTKV